MDDLLNSVGTLMAAATTLADNLLAADKSMQILVVLCAILVLLLILLARSFMSGGKAKTAAPEPGPGADTPPSEMAVPFEPRLSQLMPEQTGTIAETVAEPERPHLQARPAEARQDITPQPQTEPDMEEFKIFKRPQARKPSTSHPEEHAVPLAHELEMIESNMVRLKDMFHEGHITRDVYVDETRTLYHQAKSLIKQG